MNENVEEETNNDGSLFEREFFGVKRHNLISGTAERLLQSEKAKAKVRELLDPLMQTMADVGGWADEIKDAHPPDDELTKEFLADDRNKNHRSWHFVDLPLKATGYDRDKYAFFTNDTDVVQIGREAILVLKGESDRFEELNAFRLISHLVGDIHQPIHVACGFIDKSGGIAKIITDADFIEQHNLKSDRGGNALILPINNSTNLHSYWDSTLGGNVTDLQPLNDGQSDEAGVRSKAIEKLFNLILDEPLPDPSETPLADEPAIAGKPPEDWVIVWASDSVKQAQKAYQSIEITGNSGNNFKVKWEGKQNYDNRCGPIVVDQMKKSARNLAILLDEIWQ